MSMPETGARYLAVSALCMATHVAIMIAADRAGIDLFPALALSFCTVVLLGYALHTRFTFAVARAPGGLVRYAGAMATALPLASAFLWIYSCLCGLPMWVAAPAGAATMLLVNYGAAHWALKRRPQP
jgi:putative flippase GtrA